MLDHGLAYFHEFGLLCYVIWSGGRVIDDVGKVYVYSDAINMSCL
jgi:hypothetical protein